jgi:hypothetical protein
MLQVPSGSNRKRREEKRREEKRREEKRREEKRREEKVQKINMHQYSNFYLLLRNTSDSILTPNKQTMYQKIYLVSRN